MDLARGKPESVAAGALQHFRPTAHAMAMKRIKQELEELAREPPNALYTAAPVDDGDLFHWHATLIGPPSSPYADHKLELDIHLPEDYPLRPPQVKFLTKIFHPNVAKNGAICVNTLKRDWKPDHGVHHILLVRKLVTQH